MGVRIDWLLDKLGVPHGTLSVSDKAEARAIVANFNLSDAERRAKNHKHHRIIAERNYRLACARILELEKEARECQCKTSS